MNGLTQIKDKYGIIYDVQYDCDFQRFLIYEHNKLTIKGNYFSSADIKRYISTGQIEVINDGNKVLEKYLS